MKTRGRLYLGAVAVLAGLATHGTYAGTGDEPHYLAIADSLAFDGDVDLSNNYGGAEPLIGEGRLEPELHARPGRGGVLRPVHDIGMPLLFTPYVRVARPLAAAIAARMPSPLMRRLHLNPSVLYRHILSGGTIAIAGALALVLFGTYVTTGLSERRAFWTTLLVVLSPPLLIFSILFFTELVSALLVLLLFRLIVIEENERRRWMWAAAGIGTGFLVLVHVRNISIAAALGCLAMWTLFRRGERTLLVLYTSALAMMLTVRTFVIHDFWGTWLTTPIAKAGEWHGTAAQFAVAGGRLAGLLLDQEYGLLPYAPVFLAAVFGAAALAKAYPRLVWSAAIVSGAYVTSLLLPLTNAVGWTGGWSPAARFLTPIVPLLAIAVGTGLQRAPRMVVVPLVAIQIGIDAYAWQHPKILWNDGDGRAAVCSRIGNRICAYAPSFVKTP